MRMCILTTEGRLVLGGWVGGWVVVVAELEETFEAAGGVLGPSTVVPVGEEEDEAFFGRGGGWVGGWVREGESTWMEREEGDG